jgi:hypothetical protein
MIYALIIIFIIAFFYYRIKMNAILSEPNNDIVLTNKLNEKRYSNYSKIDEIKNLGLFRNIPNCRYEIP